MNKLIKPIAVILVNTILLAQAKVVSTSQSPVKVAYAGIQVTNVDPWAETELQNKLSAIFDGLNPEQFINSKVVLQVAKTQVDSLFLDMADAQFQRVADQTGAQYVFAGKFKNVSLPLETYDKVEKLRKVIVPDDPHTSRSKTVTILVNRELRKLNGRERKNRAKTNS